jgi:hypothetical protein
LRSKVELGGTVYYEEHLRERRVILIVPPEWSSHFEVDDTVSVNGVQYVVTKVIHNQEVTVRVFLPHDAVWLFIKSAWKGARRWLSKACARFRGARS